MAEQEFTGSRLFLNIPAIVAHDKVLLKKAPKAILLFGEIYSMLNVTGKFYMSNNTLAERLDCSRQSIINYINLLKKQGYIETENVTDTETKAITGRMITLGGVVKQVLPKENIVIEHLILMIKIQKKSVKVVLSS